MLYCCEMWEMQDILDCSHRCIDIVYIDHCSISGATSIGCRIASARYHVI